MRQIEGGAHVSGFNYKSSRNHYHQLLDVTNNAKLEFLTFLYFHAWETQTGHSLETQSSQALSCMAP